MYSAYSTYPADMRSGYTPYPKSTQINYPAYPNVSQSGYASYPGNTNTSYGLNGKQNDDRFFGAALLAPFLLGGIAGAAAAPYFYRPYGGYYSYAPYPYYPYPRYY